MPQNRLPADDAGRAAKSKGAELQYDQRKNHACEEQVDAQTGKGKHAILPQQQEKQIDGNFCQPQPAQHTKQRGVIFHFFRKAGPAAAPRNRAAAPKAAVNGTYTAYEVKLTSSAQPTARMESALQMITRSKRLKMKRKRQKGTGRYTRSTRQGQ